VIRTTVRERRAVDKEESHKFHMETFNLKKLNEVEGKKKYRVEVSDRFAVMKELKADIEINTFRQTVRENITISAKESLGYYEVKKHKSWFDEGCSELLGQRKQAKLQWLQDTNEINGDNLNNEASRHFRNKRREYLKDKSNKLATNIRDQYRRIN
jgi:hypothetical protein